MLFVSVQYCTLTVGSGTDLSLWGQIGHILLLLFRIARQIFNGFCPHYCPILSGIAIRNHVLYTFEYLTHFWFYMILDKYGDRFMTQSNTCSRAVVSNLSPFVPYLSIFSHGWTSSYIVKDLRQTPRATRIAVNDVAFIMSQIDK